MLRNYLKTAFRNFRKNKVHSLINLLSLCIGFTCCILIYTYVSHELSYGDFLKKYEQIYRIESTVHNNNQLATRYANLNGTSNPGQITSIPGIKNQSRFTPLPSIYVQVNDKKIVESNFLVSDQQFLSLFSFPLIKGNRKSALDNPNSIVISKETAQKYFGNQRALGKTLTLSLRGKKKDVKVTGILAEIPTNSHLQFDAVASRSVAKALLNTKLADRFAGYNYIRIGKNQAPNDIEQQLIKHSETTNSRPIEYRLQPLTDIHLHSSDRYELSTNSNIRYIYFLTAIGVILLIIAGINFASLSTSQALNRYTEAGIRKVLGAQKGQLIAQFLFETIFLTLVAFLLSYLVIFLILPSFNSLTNIPFLFSDFLNLQSFSIFLLVSIAIGIIVALYPAVVLSAFKPVKTLKGIAPSGKKGSTLWKSIVVVQFTASIAMIICTITIYNQLSYIQDKNLGFQKERIITFNNTLGSNYSSLKSRLKDTPGVQQVTMSSFVPGINKTSGTAQIQPKGRSDTLVFNWTAVDYNFFETYDIGFEKGRSFSREYGTDSTQAFILNKAAVKTLGWQSPIGKEFEAFRRQGKVIGVVKNINFLSLYQQYTPMVFLVRPDLYFNFSVRLAPDADIPKTTSQIRTSWKNISPDTPFQYSFVDTEFDQLYKAEQRMGSFFGILSGLALFIACLGLFSLSSFMATRKRKEIGIRKVLGASTTKVLASFYQKYLKLICIASLIAVPISYYLMSDWLQNFAFKVSLSWWIFLLAILSSTTVALIAVSYESIRAALANPIHALKTE